MDTKIKLVTYDDYRNLPNDGKRYEIIGGELLMTPAPSTIHQRILRKLLIALTNHIDNNNLGEVLCSPVDVVLSMTDVVQPDLVFIAKERSQIITKKNIVDAPDLVIEILSENTAVIDQGQKKKLYEKYGVKEYWIADPETQSIEQNILQEDSFKHTDRLTKSDKLVSQVIDGFTLPLKEIFSS